MKLDGVLRFSDSIFETFAADPGQAGALDTGSGATYCLKVPKDMASYGLTLSATLVWSDHPSTPSASVVLVNNLDLQLIRYTLTKGANGTAVSQWERMYVGNEPQGYAYKDGKQFPADALNNVEKVVVPEAQAGLYAVVVKGTSVPLGPQPYALLVTGAFQLLDPADPECISATNFLPPSGKKDAKKDAAGLSSWVIAGVVVASIVVATLFAMFLLCMYQVYKRYQRKSGGTGATDAAMPSSGGMRLGDSPFPIQMGVVGRAARERPSASADLETTEVLVEPEPGAGAGAGPAGAGGAGGYAPVERSELLVPVRGPWGSRRSSEEAQADSVLLIGAASSSRGPGSYAPLVDDVAG